MDKKLNLYEILGVSQQAESSEISEAVAQRLGDLDHAGVVIDASDKSMRKQIIRVAASTLLDPATRLAYDSKLRQGGNITGPGVSRAPTHFPTDAAALALVPIADNSNVKEAVKLRAEAISLRAEAMSLRADALLLQAGSGSSALGSNDAERASALMNFLTSGPLLRMLMFLVVMCAVAFGLSRCITNAPLQANAAATQAAEKAALQEYFQTHGVRPANMAELELLEAERRRKENEQRNEKQDVDKTKTDAAKFEEESRRRGQEVAEKLRREEEQFKRQVELDRLEEERSKAIRKESERIAEQERIRSLEEQWKRTINR
jgi:flagellar biosynthesis GTPase FlhF